MTVSEMPEVTQAGQEGSGKKGTRSAERQEKRSKEQTGGERSLSQPLLLGPCFILCSWWEYARWINLLLTAKVGNRGTAQGGCPGLWSRELGQGAVHASQALWGTWWKSNMSSWAKFSLLPNRTDWPSPVLASPRLLGGSDLSPGMLLKALYGAQVSPFKTYDPSLLPRQGPFTFCG